MQVNAIKTSKVIPDSIDIFAFLDQALVELHESEILIITSKVVSLCEKRALPQHINSEADLVAQESDKYAKEVLGDFQYFITIAYHTLILTAGVDSSNSDRHYVLLPENPQASANAIRHYLVQRFGLKNVGVIITDSTSQPLRRGTIGIALAHSGFVALRDYRGTPDIFGHSLKVSQSNLVGGLAAAAVAVMGEGAEQTPLCIISGVSFVEFEGKDPTVEELAHLYVDPEQDLFSPLLNGITWQFGKRHNK